MDYEMDTKVNKLDSLLKNSPYESEVKDVFFLP